MNPRARLTSTARGGPGVPELVGMLSRSSPLARGAAFSLFLALLAVSPQGWGLLVLAMPAVLWGFGALVSAAVVGKPGPRETQFPLSRLFLQMLAGLTGLSGIALLLHTAGVSITRTAALAALIVASLLAGFLARARARLDSPAERTCDGSGHSVRPLGTVLGVVIAAALAVAIGGGAVAAYARLPHRAPLAYTSLGWAGWAADADGPVTVPPGGLTLPLTVDRRGGAPLSYRLTLQLGGQTVGPPRILPAIASATRHVSLHIPAPPDGCLYRVIVRLHPLASDGRDLTSVLYVRGAGRC